jgi:hypothetical protein
MELYTSAKRNSHLRATVFFKKIPFPELTQAGPSGPGCLPSGHCVHNMLGVPIRMSQAPHFKRVVFNGGRTYWGLMKALQGVLGDHHADGHHADQTKVENGHQGAFLHTHFVIGGIFMFDGFDQGEPAQH